MSKEPFQAPSNGLTAGQLEAAKLLVSCLAVKRDQELPMSVAEDLTKVHPDDLLMASLKLLALVLGAAERVGEANRELLIAGLGVWLANQQTENGSS
jgi:hypothetical protein